MSTSPLFQPLKLGALELPNRVIMAPLTRNRADAPGNVPSDLAVTYYTQRVSAGLIISEATQVCQEGQGYPTTPGIHTDAQVEGWKKITSAVHGAGGRMVLQLWHVGRVSHNSFQPGGAAPVAPSAVQPKVKVYDPAWQKVDCPTPRALELSELPSIVEAYRKGAENAKRAGFLGVEVHSANGYLLDEFLRDCANKRTDAYGGSVQNRARLLLEVMEAVVGVWGPDRVGVRLSPLNPNNDMSNSNPRAIFSYVAQELSRFKLAWVHVLEDVKTPAEQSCLAEIKRLCGAPVIANFGYTQETAEAAIREGRVDAIAFGKPFISNPDLVRRLREGAPLNAWDMATFYATGPKGYTDYPALG